MSDKMTALHEIEGIYILNTVTSFSITFYGTKEDIHDPNNKLEVRVTLQMMKGEGRKSLDKAWNRVQYNGMDEKWIECIYDPEAKTLTPRKPVKEFKIANLRSVIIAVDTVVKESLVNQKFGNLVNEEDY